MAVVKNSSLIRVLSALSALTMLSVVLLAGIFIVMEADHDCEGEYCPVCQCLEQCQNALHQISAAAAVVTVSTALTFFITSTAFRFERTTQKDTPVTSKVRLNI